MKWDGKVFADIVKESLLELFGHEMPQAARMGNKEYADYLKSSHEMHELVISNRRVRVITHNEGLAITFADKCFPDDSDGKPIALTWSMAARYIRTHIRIWKFEKATECITEEVPETDERMEAVTMGGQVYETLADQLLERGRLEGKEEGRVEGKAEGRTEGIFLSVRRLADTSQYTEQEACDILGAEYTEYLKFKEKNWME